MNRYQGNNLSRFGWARWATSKDEFRAFTTTVFENRQCIEPIIGFGSPRRRFLRCADSRFEVPLCHPRHRFIEITVDEDREVKEWGQVPGVEKQVESLDNDQPVIGCDSNGVGGRIFDRMIECREVACPRFMKAQEVRAQGDGVKGMRSATAGEVVRGEFGAREVVAVHRNDGGEGNPRSELRRQGGLAAAWNAGDGDHVGVRALAKGFENGLNHSIGKNDVN